MKKYDSLLEGYSLYVATIKHGIVTFYFNPSPVLEWPEGTDQAYIDAYNLDESRRQGIFALISNNEEKMAEFVNLLGDDPNTAFLTFASQNNL